MKNLILEPFHFETVARHHLTPTPPGRLNHGTRCTQVLKARHRNAFPHFSWRKVLPHSRETTDVIRMAMCQYRDIQPPNAESPECRYNHPLANRRSPSHRARGVYKHRPSSWPLDERRISLPNVKKRHP